MRRVSIAALTALLVAAHAAEAQDRLIRDWLVRGPMSADTGRAGVLRDYLEAEATVLPTPGDRVAGGPFRTVSADSTGRVNLNALDGPADWSVAYAHTYVWSPDERAILLVMDSDDDLVARVNGQRVWVHVVPRGIGPGRDTARVRLAAGWNTVLLKVVNRTGGFDLLGKLADAPGGGTVAPLRLAVERPSDVTRHRFPAATVDVGPLTVRGSARWRQGDLDMRGTVAVSAWGPDIVRDVRVSLASSGTTLSDTVIGALAPGEVLALPMAASFDDLRAVALGERALSATARWQGGRSTTQLFVDPEPLLRMHGAAVDLFEPRDTLPTPERLPAALRVPRAFDGLTLELLTRGLGARARVQVNGAAIVVANGTATLCAPCRADDPLDLEIRPDPRRPLWLLPQAQIREPGFAEYADGARWAAQLGQTLPDSARPVAAEWLAAVGRPSYTDLLARAGASTAVAAAVLRHDTLLLVGNSHIDAAWLWRWEETIDVIRNTWRTALKLVEVFPGYVFAGSSAAFYDAMDRLEPALADSLAEAAGGAWAPVGGWWVEADLNNSAGESLVRQGLYGQRYFQRRFGRRSTVAWTPDTFGYPWTMPQILAGSGFDAFVTQKMRWNDSTTFPYNAFWWEGLDGTRLLSYNPYGYTHDLDPGTLVREHAEDRARSGTGNQIVLYGVGDHGGGPTIAMLRRAEHMARVPTFPAIRYTGPEQAIAAVRSAEPDSGFPVWDDEMYLEYHRGTYTSQAGMKRRNRLSEVGLQTVEALAAVDTAPYPRAALERAWRLVLFNQFHDILPGSGIDSVYMDANATYDTAWALLDSLKTASFARLRGRMDTRGGGTPVVVFNPLGWARSGRVAVGADKTDEADEADRMWVYVESVPAFGALVIHVPDDERPADRFAAPTAGPTWIENAFLRVEVDTGTGAVTRIYDKRAGREVLAAGGRANVLQVLDDRPAQWDAWNVMPNPETWEVTAVRRAGGRAGRDAAWFEIERAWGNSVFRQTLVLSREADYLEVENDVDWHERRKLLKVGFAFSVAPDSATFEIPYGTIGRSGRPQTQAERAKFEVPGQRWADLSADGYGVSVLNDSKYGWDYRDGTLRLSLLKAPIWPDSTADRGPHRFRFAILPHAGDWRAARIERRATEYNVPLTAAFEPAHPGALGPVAGFGGIVSDGATVAWLKRAEDSDKRVLRIVEWHGQAADVTVTLPCAARRVHRANLLEDPGASLPIDGDTTRLSLRAFEIATLMVECRS